MLKPVNCACHYTLIKFSFTYLKNKKNPTTPLYISLFKRKERHCKDAVCHAGSVRKKLWQAYFAHTDVRAVRDKLKLNSADAGWYQIRTVLQPPNTSGDFPPVSFKSFEEAYKTLSEKLQPMVYAYGFLK